MDRERHIDTALCPASPGFAPISERPGVEHRLPLARQDGRVRASLEGPALLGRLRIESFLSRNQGIPPSESVSTRVLMMWYQLA